MKMLSRMLCLVLALLLCSGALAEGSPEDVLATVNGTAITRAAFDDYHANLTAFYAYEGYDVTDAQLAAQIRELTLSTLVQLTLMDQKIAEMNIALTEAEKAYAELEGREMWAADLRGAMSWYGVTDADSEEVRAAALVQVLDELQKMGYTEQSYIDDAVENALYVKLEDQMVAGVSVTDTEVAAGYHARVEQQKQSIGSDVMLYEYVLQMNQLALMGYSDQYVELYYMPEGYRRMTHILLATDEALLTAWLDIQAAYEEQQSSLEEGAELAGDAVTAEDVENARLAVLASVQGEVDAIRQKLEEGESFDSLIAQYTADDGMDAADEIKAGWQVHMDSVYLPTGYRDAAFSVEEIGAVAEPFVSEMGVYLLCYAGDIDGGALPLTTVQAEGIRQELLEEAQTAKYNEVMNGWIAEAELVYSDEALTFMGYME